MGSIAENEIINKNVKIKLQDLPDMGYLSTDKPFKRGLLWVKTNEMSGGYFNDNENNQMNFDEEGYFNTGDIVEFDNQTGRLVVIDRFKNFVKMGQSAFVAPGYSSFYFSLFILFLFIYFIYLFYFIYYLFIY